MRVARKSEPLTAAAPRRTPARPTSATLSATPADSPALSLQADLSARWEMETDASYQQGPRWSPRRMLAVTGGVSLALWAVIGLAIHALVTS